MEWTDWSERNGVQFGVWRGGGRQHLDSGSGLMGAVGLDDWAGGRWRGIFSL